MKTRKILAVIMAMVMLFSVVSTSVITASAADVSYYNVYNLTDRNGVIRAGHYTSFYSGKIVFYPQEMLENDETYPVIVWANGTMCPPVLYYSLLSLIAKGGYIVIANTNVMSASGEKQIESIDFILEENADETSVFYQRVDAENIGAIGHSQGGRSSVNAAQADDRIDCIMSIAGSNFEKEVENLTTPALFVTGQFDIIVMSSKWVEPAYELSQGPAVFASLYQGIHTSCILEAEKYSSYAVEWFDAWLKNDAEAKDTFRDGGAFSADPDWQKFACKGF